MRVLSWGAFSILFLQKLEQFYQATVNNYHKANCLRNNCQITFFMGFDFFPFRLVNVKKEQMNPEELQKWDLLLQNLLCNDTQTIQQATQVVNEQMQNAMSIVALFHLVSEIE